jgi:hypothetical protein
VTSIDRDAFIIQLHRQGRSVRSIANEVELSRSRVHQVIAAYHASGGGPDDDDDSVEDLLTLLDAAAAERELTPPFTFVGMQAELVALDRHEEPHPTLMERFLDAAGRSCSMADLYRWCFRDGSEGDDTLEDADRQIAAAGWVRVDNGDGTWHWERAENVTAADTVVTLPW